MQERSLNFLILILIFSSNISYSKTHEKEIVKSPSYDFTSSFESPFHVVLDPGHGGSDEGAVYQRGLFRITEKQITLNLAKKIAELLRSRGIQTTLTRSDDSELSLVSRTALANQLKADVFISIHTNSSGNMNNIPKSLAAEGVETFILNTTSDASSKRLAKIETSVVHLESDDLDLQHLDVARIIKDLRLDANLKESKRLACLVQSQLSKATQPIYIKNTKRDRGVKQSLFHVLLAANMPSILAEVGFLTHSYDRSLMISSSGQNKMAQSMTQAIEEFRDSHFVLKNQNQRKNLSHLDPHLRDQILIKNKKIMSECKMN